MTHKERMLAAIRGQKTDCIPYAPRLDLWYRANKRADTLPDKYKKASLKEIVVDLDMGYHAVVPKFKNLRSPKDEVDRALGIYNLKDMPYRTILENIDRKVRIEGDRTYVEYETPVGTLDTVVVYDEHMRKAGVSITHIEKYLFKDINDYAALGYLFENARVEPNYEGYLEFADEVGDLGLAVGFVSLAASPMHLMQRELMPMELFYYEMHDHPNEMAQLAGKIGLYWRQLFQVVSQSPAEVVLLGANYDAGVTPPPFFEKHILPSLKEFSNLLHPQNKYLLTHPDGENTGLLEHYLKSGIDIADSICPEPMTKLSFQQVRDCFKGKITIMGGIPSVALLESSLPDNKYEAFIDEFFSQIGKGDHLILGISDTTPPAAKFERIVQIAQRIEEFGPIGN